LSCLRVLWKQWTGAGLDRHTGDAPSFRPYPSHSGVFCASQVRDSVLRCHQPDMDRPLWWVAHVKFPHCVTGESVATSGSGAQLGLIYLLRGGQKIFTSGRDGGLGHMTVLALCHTGSLCYSFFLFTHSSSQPLHRAQIDVKQCQWHYSHASPVVFTGILDMTPRQQLNSEYTHKK